MKGFTLVETLVALAALAMLATGALGVASASTASQDAIRAHQEATHTLMRLRAMIKADLGQAAARRPRDVNGTKAQAALRGGGLGDGVFLSLVRRGWDNPLDQQRASLQYVEYRLVGGRIERAWRRHVDGAPLQAPQVLIEACDRCGWSSSITTNGWRDGRARRIVRCRAPCVCRSTSRIAG